LIRLVYLQLPIRRDIHTQQSHSKDRQVRRSALLLLFPRCIAWPVLHVIEDPASIVVSRDVLLPDRMCNDLLERLILR